MPAFRATTRARGVLALVMLASIFSTQLVVFFDSYRSLIVPNHPCGVRRSSGPLGIGHCVEAVWWFGRGWTVA